MKRRGKSWAVDRKEWEEVGETNGRLSVIRETEEEDKEETWLAEKLNKKE